MPYKILIWGTGSSSYTVSKWIKKDIKVLAYIDNDYNKSAFLGLSVILPEKIIIYDYDYIIICSQYYEQINRQLNSMQIDSEKILICSIKHIEDYFIYKSNPFYKKLKRFDNLNYKPELLVTGISYHNDGIEDKCFTIPSFNFALGGQDIYYDYQILKFLYDNYDMSCLKYVILGLCYYSFEYDLSKSRNAWQIIRYFPYISKSHNLIESRYYNSYCENVISNFQSMEIYEKIFERKITYSLNYEEGEITAKNDYNKNYPSTVYENKLLLEEFISFILEKNLKCSIVIMPASKYYTKFVNLDIKEKFYKNIKELLDKYSIPILDYFNIDDYPDKYWYHVNHFNNMGAERFTKQLENDIYKLIFRLK